MLQLIDPLQTVLSTQNQHEVIATYMADKVHPRIDPFVQALRQAQQNLVTLGIAVKVGQRLNSRNSLSVLNGHISR